MPGRASKDAQNSILRTESIQIWVDDNVTIESVALEPYREPSKVAFQSPAIGAMASAIEREDAEFGSDQRDMERMGRKVELPRTWGLHSCIGYSVILGSSWVYVLVTGTYNLENGGPAGTVWTFLFACFGMLMTILSVAEIASIIPSSGTQYCWTSQYAPQSCHKALSFVVGWLTVIGWTAATILTCYICGQQTRSLILLYHRDYQHEAWHSSLLTIAFTLIAVTINIFLVRKLAFLEGLVLCLYVAGFMFMLVVLWVMGDHNPATEVFTDFENENGWPSMFVASMVNIGAPIITLIGADSGATLSEEIRNASWGVPRAIVSTAVVSYLAGMMMQVTFLFNAGVNVKSSTDASDVYQSYVAAMIITTQSRAATTFCIVLVCFLLVMCAVNQSTTASRQIYAFARDHGMPFSKWLSAVRKDWDFPFNALLAMLMVSIAISLILITSTDSFQVLNTLTVGGLLVSYLIFIVVVFWRKLVSPEQFTRGKFLLGRKRGLAVNLCAIIFLSIAVIFVNFPSNNHPTAADNNYTIAAWAVVAIVITLYYRFSGRKHYTSPVERTRKTE